MAALAHGIGIKPPTGWQHKAAPPQGIHLQFTAPAAQDGFTPNMNVTLQEPDSAFAALKDPLEMAERMAATQARVFPLYKTLRKEARSAGKAKGALLVSTYAYGNLDLASVQFVVLHAGDLVAVSYTCIARQLDKLMPEFEKSLSTLRLDG